MMKIMSALDCAWAQSSTSGSADLVHRHHHGSLGIVVAIMIWRRKAWRKVRLKWRNDSGPVRRMPT